MKCMARMQRHRQSMCSEKVVVLHNLPKLDDLLFPHARSACKSQSSPQNPSLRRFEISYQTYSHRLLSEEREYLQYLTRRTLFSHIPSKTHHRRNTSTHHGLMRGLVQATESARTTMTALTSSTTIRNVTMPISNDLDLGRAHVRLLRLQYGVFEEATIMQWRTFSVQLLPHAVP